MSATSEIIEHDKRLREKVRRSNDHEHIALAELFDENERYLLTCKYLAEFEWLVVSGRQDLGKGDSVFVSSDGKEALVVEVKVLNPVSATYHKCTYHTVV